MQFTNNFNVRVVVFIFDITDHFFYSCIRNPGMISPILPLARSEMGVDPHSQITFTHPTDRNWLIGVKPDTIWGRLGPFTAPLTDTFYTATSLVDLTALGEVILRNPVVAPIPTPRLTIADISAPLPLIKGHLVGVGRANVTDMAVEDPSSALPMQGWASPSQLSKTLDTDSIGDKLPLMARAFILTDPTSNTRAVFVVADIWSCSIAVKQEVVRRLSFGLVEMPYQAANITIAGTHTHSGAAGYLHHFLYNAMATGFDPHVFESLVSGIVRAIELAHINLAPGRVSVAQGLLGDITRNRSMPAFANNPTAMTARFPNAVDETMTQLLFEHETAAGSGKYTPIGLLNWFAIHPTNMGKQSTAISGDNKGWAAHIVERDQGKGFVAGFANGCAGDVSGNFIPGQPGFKSVEVLKLPEHRDRMIFAGERQADHASRLMRRKGAVMTGPITALEYRINLASRTGAVAALGISMAAGSVEDGGQGLVSEGVTLKDITDPTNTSHGSSLAAALSAGIAMHLGHILSAVSALFSGNAFHVLHRALTFTPVTDAQMIVAHFPKPIMLTPGAQYPDPWTPETVPLQLVRIGRFAMLGVPAEVTTVAGQHLRDAVADGLGQSGVEMIAISTYTNGYAQYVTTAEEYDLQHYEGASTLFGRRTLGTIVNATTDLAKAVQTGGVLQHDGALVDLRARVLTKRRMTFRNETGAPLRFRLYHPNDTVYAIPLWPDADFTVANNADRAIVLPFPHSLAVEAVQVIWGPGRPSARRPPRQQLFALSSDLILARSMSDVVHTRYFPTER